MSFVWLNGQLCAAGQAHVSLADRGLTLGDGLFETFRVKNGSLCHIGLHMQRLQEGGAVLGLPVPDSGVVAHAAQDLLAATGVRQGSVRLTVTRGVAARGLLPPAQVQPTVFMTVAEGAARVASIAVMTSQTIRRDETSPLNRIKSLNYLPNILARQEAGRAGCEDALLLNLQGRVAESSISTVVLQQQAHFITPPIAEGALPGVARAVLLRAGLLREERLARERLHTADGLYLINSLSVRQVHTVDGQPVACSTSGWRKICAALAVASPAGSGA